MLFYNMPSLAFRTIMAYVSLHRETNNLHMRKQRLTAVFSVGSSPVLEYGYNVGVSDAFSLARLI